MTRHLLLISSSRLHGTAYLEHCRDAIRVFLEADHVQRVLFIPYALKDMDAYEEKAKAAFAEAGFELTSVHREESPRDAIMQAQAVFVGGGNTFRLLKLLYEHDLIKILRERVQSGTLRYIGTSAGTNVATASIHTTNDMPIVQPPSFHALNLVSFNINPHFIDADTSSTHMGETRETRIAEFHEENVVPVVGIREGTWLLVEGNKIVLQGSRGGKIFRQGEEPQELQDGADLSFLA
eukprot:TRINITY_DN944_c0_g1_i1.p1 TRINITY_DN944_c0_g1~~TRINITY_DN944_c0_g1_i1.p1  ORF type:complete len:246 (+),score=61.77 TRINITY_DN944_c0_g1_i1:30-740(+)